MSQAITMFYDKVTFQLLFTERFIDIFRRGNGFWWQHKIYREDDGHFCEPCNGPYRSIDEAMKEAAPYNVP